MKGRAGRIMRAASPAVVAFVLAACSATPGSSDSSQKVPESSATKVPDKEITLTVWDQEVRGGQNAQIERLNAQFEKQYPNITIKRVAKSFTDLNTTLKLAVSDEKAPDVVQANQGYPVMGQLVKGGLLRPLDGYAGAYGWEDRYSPTLLQLNKFSPDGQTFGSGNLYGLSQVGELVGVYYNKQKLQDLGLSVPTTFEEFTKALGTAKQQGEIPIQFGNADKWPGIHEFQAVQNEMASKGDLRGFVFGESGASFATDDNEQAAATLREWADKGYFTPGFNGVGYDDAAAQFSKGEGVFCITGTWLAPDIEPALGKDLGFFLLPPPSGGELTTLGGEGLPFAITSKSANPEAAAAYIDFITNPNATKVIAATGGLPAPKTSAAETPESGVQADIFEAWKEANGQDAIVPYIDYATPTFYDTITAQVQTLMAGKATPQEFVDTVQQDYESFQASG
jgi:raffinose/stachyose/melibiose transport system substrate-binding protein